MSLAKGWPQWLELTKAISQNCGDAKACFRNTTAFCQTHHDTLRPYSDLHFVDDDFDDSEDSTQPESVAQGQLPACCLFGFPRFTSAYFAEAPGHTSSASSGDIIKESRVEERFEHVQIYNAAQLDLLLSTVCRLNSELNSIVGKKDLLGHTQEKVYLLQELNAMHEEQIIENPDKEKCMSELLLSIKSRFDDAFDFFGALLQALHSIGAAIGNISVVRIAIEESGADHMHNLALRMPVQLLESIT